MLRKRTFLPPCLHLIGQFIKRHLVTIRREQHILAQWLRQYFCQDHSVRSVDMKVLLWKFCLVETIIELPFRWVRTILFFVHQFASLTELGFHLLNISAHYWYCGTIGIQYDKMIRWLFGYTEVCHYIHQDTSGLRIEPCGTPAIIVWGSDNDCQSSSWLTLAVCNLWLTGFPGGFCVGGGELVLFGGREWKMEVQWASLKKKILLIFFWGGGQVFGGSLPTLKRPLGNPG